MNKSWLYVYVYMILYDSFVVSIQPNAKGSEDQRGISVVLIQRQQSCLLSHFGTRIAISGWWEWPGWQEIEDEEERRSGEM